MSRTISVPVINNRRPAFEPQRKAYKSRTTLLVDCLGCACFLRPHRENRQRFHGKRAN